MEEITVIYSSKYGTTKGYTEELHRKHPGVLLKIKDYKAKNISGDVVAFFVPIHAFDLLNPSPLERDTSRIRDRKVTAFCVGVSNYNKKEFRRLYRHHFDNPLKDAPASYGRGAWQIDKMTRMDKALLRFNYHKIKNKRKTKPQAREKDFLTIYGKNWDWVDFPYLEDLEGWVRVRDPFDE